MVRLIIQEMEDTLVEVRSASAKTWQIKDISRQVERLEQEATDWAAKAELALSKGRRPCKSSPCRKTEV